MNNEQDDDKRLPEHEQAIVSEVGAVVYDALTDFRNRFGAAVLRVINDDLSLTRHQSDTLLQRMAEAFEAEFDQ
jgi:hypothetical protein